MDITTPVAGFRPITISLQSQVDGFSPPSLTFAASNRTIQFVTLPSLNDDLPRNGVGIEAGEVCQMDADGAWTGAGLLGRERQP